MISKRKLINFDGENSSVCLNNGKIAYVIYIGAQGQLETVYFGKATSSLSDFECIRDAKADATRYYDVKTEREEICSDGFRIDVARLELSSHGLADKRYSPIVVRKSDGSFETDFRYVGHQIYEGIKPLAPPLPHAFGENCETVEFLLKDTETDLYVKLFLTVFADKNVLVKNYEIVNNTKEPIQIRRAMSMQLDLPGTDYKLVHFRGRGARERFYTENDLIDGAQEISSNVGRSSHEENPFVYLRSEKASEDYGEAIGFNLVYSGNFKFRVDCGPFRSVRIAYGINDEDFEWLLAAGETFVTPQAVIAYSDTGTDGMSQELHRFIRENLITYRKEREYKPILFNSWEGCHLDFDTDSILSYIDDACKIGTELFVLDDGWFGTRNDESHGLGDWKVNQAKIDLRRVIAHCKEKRIKFGIWFEPEMVNYKSELYRSHPEYVLGKSNANTRSLSRHQFPLDFSSPQAVEELYRQMKCFLQEYPVDYIKWDHNRMVAEHYSRAYGPERQGEIYHRLTLGYYELLNRLTGEYPQILFEGCASGGGRFDLGTLYYCPQIWASDESDPAQRMFINYNTSLGYPLSTIGTHVNDSRIASYKTKATLALFGTYGYEMNPNLLTDREKAELSEIAKIYKRYHKKVIEEGTLYHLRSPNESNLMCMESVSADKTTALVILMNRLKEADEFRFIRLKGLDENKFYHNDYENRVHSGEYYEKVGLNFSREWYDEFSCRLVILREI